MQLNYLTFMHAPLWEARNFVQFRALVQLVIVLACAVACEYKCLLCFDATDPCHYAQLTTQAFYKMLFLPSLCWPAVHTWWAVPSVLPCMLPSLAARIDSPGVLQ
jgi:hypothetical protein